jgi:uncharacterized Zn-finger protein
MDADTVDPTNVIETDSQRVACDGGGGSLGHPRVFINLREDGAGACPYCGRQYVLKPNAGEGGGH